MHSSAPIQEEHKRAAVPIAHAVRRLRSARSWTLDELAARSGISRRLIVQIEQAQSNPSIGTLLRLADAFEVALSELLPEPPTATAGMRPAGDELRLWSGPRGGAGRLLINRGPLELWSWTLRPGESHESEAHHAGCVELLTVTTGALQLDVGGESFNLAGGDSAWFEATDAHAYRNPTRSTTHFTLVVFGP
jgi:transcriptional regulator with XRE-family HTH domain